jgi:hypothetical protein
MIRFNYSAQFFGCLALLSVCASVTLASIGPSATLIDPHCIITSYKDQQKSSHPIQVKINNNTATVIKVVDDPYGLRLRLLLLDKPITEKPSIPRAYLLSQTIQLAFLNNTTMIISSPFSQTTVSSLVPLDFTNSPTFAPRAIVAMNIDTANEPYTSLPDLNFKFQKDLKVRVQKFGAPQKQNFVQIGSGYFTFDQNIQNPTQLIAVKAGIPGQSESGTYDFQPVLLTQKISNWINNTILKSALGAK